MKVEYNIKFSGNYYLCKVAPARARDRKIILAILKTNLSLPSPSL